MPTHILVIEDNAPNLELMSYLLRAFEYEVSTAEDGPEGFECVRTNSPDLVICDVNLPSMDPSHVAPILLLSASAEFSDRLRALKSGVVKLLRRPIEPETLVAEISAALGSTKGTG